MTMTTDERVMRLDATVSQLRTRIDHLERIVAALRRAEVGRARRELVNAVEVEDD